MLDFFAVFNKGGMILWQLQMTALKGSPLEALIKTVLLQERSGDAQFNYNSDNTNYVLKWDFANELDLVFVAVYQSILSLPYVEDLLSSVKKEFTGKHYAPRKYSFPDFHDDFQQLLADAEQRAEELKKPRQASTFDPSKKTGVRKEKKAPSKAADGKAAGGKAGEAASTKESGAKGDQGDTTGASESDSTPAKSSGPAGFDLSKLKGRRGGKDSKGSGTDSKGKGGGVDSGKEDGGKKKKPTKKARVWEEGPDGGKLDFSVKKDPAELAKSMALKEDEKGASRMDDADEAWSDEEDETETEVESESGTESDASGVRKQTWFSNMMRNVVGTEALIREDIQPVIDNLKQQLMTKNVAEEIAENLCESVAASLEGKKMPSFTRVATTVKAALQQALEKILSPKRSVDVLRAVRASRDAGRPYVIVFVGVNGVGKSTNLAKVAYWLQQHGMSVMLCACDTFRSGAVEQLRTHAQRLEVDLFERGYEKDPAAVANEGIKAGAKNKKDVILVDTAGRMQDNEPLMRALAKLVNINEPDLVLFVGEALVGNDAVDQLSKFNARLEDLSTSNPPRLIDGIVLTKFDTIDDKVGAALSMVYTSGSPIMFVGCGQTYTDLRKLNVKSVVKSLLS